MYRLSAFLPVYPGEAGAFEGLDLIWEMGFQDQGPHRAVSPLQQIQGGLASDIACVALPFTARCGKIFLLNRIMLETTRALAASLQLLTGRRIIRSRCELATGCRAPARPHDIL